MSTISASTTTTTAYKVTADTTGTLVLQTGATPTTAVTVDTSQNVGVGTSSPNTKLEAYTSTSGAQGLLTLQQADNTPGNSWGIDFRRTTGSANALRARIFAYRDGNEATGLTFSYANTGGTLTEGMRLDSSGNLLMGTTSALGYTGTVFNIKNSGSYVGLNASSSEARVFATWDTTAIPMTFYMGGTERMRIDTSGNFLIGATAVLNSNYKFSVVGNRTNLAANSSALNLYLQYNSATSGFFLGSPSADALAMTDSNGNERSRIDSSGRFMVGTTTQANGLAGYNVKITSYSTTEAAMVITDNASATGYFPITVWQTATTGNNLFIGFLTDGGSLRGNIDYNRGAAQVRYNTSSDATLKNVIGDAPRQKSIDILNSTRIREYSWKDDPTNKPQIGVIAQELYETFKGAVSVGGQETTTDENGNETTKYRPWAVDKTAFTFHLVSGFQHLFDKVQEQQAIITQLQADVAALKGAQ
jgi:Chaperone of endosialidase